MVVKRPEDELAARAFHDGRIIALEQAATFLELCVDPPNYDPTALWLWRLWLAKRIREDDLQTEDGQ